MSAWGAVLPAVAPLIAGAFMRRPGVPNLDPSLAAGPDRSEYVNQILESGFNPQSELYRLASEQMMNQINAGLARGGLMNSSLAFQQQRSGMADLANKFLENELQRRIQSLNAALGYDRPRAEAMYGAQMGNMGRQYQADVADRQALLGGIGSIAGAYSGWRGRQDERQYQNDMMDRYMNARYGIPGGA